MTQQDIGVPDGSWEIPNPGGSSPANPESWQSLCQKTQANFSELYGRSPSGVAGSRLLFTAKGVNLNALGDTIVPLALPSGCTRFLVAGFYISNGSVSLTTAKAGLYTAAAAGGVAIAANTTILTGITNDTDATNSNAASLAITDSLTRSFLLSGQPNLYINVGTVQGAAATADFTIELIPLP